MNIATALNQKYLRYAAVMLWSLCENNPGPVRAFLLHSELAESDIFELREVLKDFDIEVVELKIQREIFSDRLPHNDQWSIETYYRLLLLDVLPEDVERLFYIDVDIIINKSLKELYENDLGGNDILAAEDSCGCKTWNLYTEKQKTMFRHMHEMGYKYFNAGFMLMNISQMRITYNFQRYLQAIEEWDYQMAAPDQDILNYVHWKKVAYIDYNYYDLFARIAHNRDISYQQARNEVAVVHYAGEKPWDAGAFHFDIERLWWDYAKKTPFYQELLEEFLHKIMTDTCLENYVKDLLKQIDMLRNQLGDSLSLNQKLLTMLQK